VTPVRGRGAWPTDGFTLVELLVSVAILGIAVVGAAGTMFTMTVFSDFERRHALAEVEARRLAEAIRAAPYAACGTAVSTYMTYFNPTEPGHTTAEISDFRLWLRDSTNPLDVSDARFLSYPEYQAQGYCIDGASDERGTDHGLQRMTVTVSVGASPPASVSFVISKRLSQY